MQQETTLRKSMRRVSGAFMSTKTREGLARQFHVRARGYLKLARLCERFVTHPAFDPFIIFCILLVGVATFLEMEFEQNGEGGPALSAALAYVQQITLTVFTFEIVLKIVASPSSDPVDALALSPPIPPRRVFQRALSPVDIVVVVSYVLILLGADGARRPCAGCSGCSRS